MFSASRYVSQSRWLTLSLLAFITILSVLPTVRLLLEALQHWDRGLNAPIFNVLSSTKTWIALKNSLYTASVSTLFAVVLGGGFSFVLTLTNIRLRSIWVFCFMLPMMIPPQVTALSWLQLFGPSSVILNTLSLQPEIGSPQPMYSAGGIISLLAIQHAPLVYLALRSQLICIPRDLVEAARLSGASQWRLWITIIVPLSYPALITGAAIAFVSALGNFGIPAMLGIPAGYIVLPTLIYQQMAGFGNDILSEVASLSMLIAVVVFVGMLLQQWVQQKSSFTLVGLSSQSAFFRLGRWRLLVESLMLIILSFILIAPLLALVVSSLVPALGVALNADTFTFSAYSEMLLKQGVTRRAFFNSIVLASAAAFILMIVALPLSYRLTQMSLRLRSLFASAIEVPFAIPGIVLSVAFILLFARPIPLINLQLYGSLGIILLAYLSCFLNVCLKPVSASMAQMDTGLIDAARICGASPLQVLKHILLPLNAPALFAGGLLVFLISINELTVSALLWSAGNETLGVLIFNLDESGDSVLASALAVLVVILVAGLMAFLSAMAPKMPKGVIPWHC